MIEKFYLIHSETLTGSNTPCQSGPGSNGDKGVLHIP